MLDRLRLDLRQTWRSLAARQGWTFGIVAVFTIGLSLVGTVFAIADPFLSRPLPYPSANRLVLLRLTPLGADARENADDVSTLGEWQSRTDLFEDVAAYGEFERWRLLSADGVLLVSVRRVSPNFLDLLGSSIGATAAWQSAPPGAPQPAVITAGPGPTRAAADRLMNTLVPDDRGSHLEIIAALPDDFLFPSARVGSRPDVIVAVTFGALVERREGATRSLTGVARLRPGIEPSTVNAALGPRLAAHGLRLTVESLPSHMAGGVRPIALAVLAASLLIAISCAANVVNLLVARGVFRAPEFSTRVALGASRADLLRLVVVELAVLVATATAVSLFVTRLTLVFVERAIPSQYAALGTPTLGLRVGLFILLLAVATAAICLPPAWISARVAPGPRRLRARTVDGGIRGLRFLLSAGQTAVAMVLVVGAALLVRSYANLRTQETGYAHDTVVATVSHGAGLAGPALFDRVEAMTRGLRAVPGVTGAAAGIGTGSLLDAYSSVGGARLQAGEVRGLLTAARVEPSYFTVVGNRLVAGRAFDQRDRGRPVVIVNQAFAARFWPDTPREAVVGRTLVIDDIPHAVVGLLQNAHDRSLDRPPAPRYYHLLDNGEVPLGRVSYVLRLNGGSPPVAAIRRAVATADPTAVVEAVDSIGGRLAEGVRDQTFATLLLSLFGAAGLGVSATGIFATIGFIVARRTREIAIRVALGASARRIRRLVMRDAVFAALSGAALGLFSARLLARFLESYLYGLEAGNLRVPLAAAVGMLVVTGVASWWPTRRALNVEPTLSLRME